MLVTFDHDGKYGIRSMLTFQFIRWIEVINANKQSPFTSLTCVFISILYTLFGLRYEPM